MNFPLRTCLGNTLFQNSNVLSSKEFLEACSQIENWKGEASAYNYDLSKYKF